MNRYHVLPTILLVTMLVTAKPSAASESKLGAAIAGATEPVSGQLVDAVIPLPENTVLAREKHPSGSFWVKTRKDQIERFRCSRCHSGKANQPQVNDGLKLAHGGINLSHGQQKLPCTTCHHKEQRDFLALEGGDKIDFDHAYQLCGQCHFRQKEDWIGGAHGKRDNYWDGDRVIWSCTECHNPHSPRFETRWPKTYSKTLNK
ncbi:MAG: hypothetical protein EP304_04505 [Deltaproteobacteria bacterium]|nr:MAG: hypothetical protein EP304_04505 [Deltaproteobacteria bacterium]